MRLCRSRDIMYIIHEVCRCKVQEMQITICRTQLVRTMAQLHQYKPPKWADKMKNIPKYFVELAHKNTPIHEWLIPGVAGGFKLSIKRDDMTGNTLSGNKVRKLEFLLADALDKGCDTVLTCGGIQSNHCRVTAVAARELGLDSYLFLRHREQHTDIGSSGNLLMNRLVGSHIVLVPYGSYNNVLKPHMEKLAEALKEKGRSPYIVPLGGSSYLGTFGYIAAFQEMMEQNILEEFDDIVVSTGSGGTSSGIAIANYLTGSRVKCHAVNVCDDAKYFYDHLSETLVSAGIHVRAEDILDIIEGYKGEGYAVSTDDELEEIVHIASSTGVFLDRVYTVKAVRGMLGEMRKNPSRFKGNRVLYIHTGGLFGLFDGQIDQVLLNTSSSTVTYWGNVQDPPPC